MYRFVTFIWNAEDRDASALITRMQAPYRLEGSKWNLLVNLDGMTVFAVEPSRGGLRSYLLPEGRGLVIGRLFRTNADAGSSVGVETIDASAARLAASSGGRSLTESYWGSYVAFLHDASTRRAYVMRDCSGKLPCFRAHTRGVSVFFADIADIIDLPTLRLTVNWRYLAAFIHCNDLQVRDSALNEVSELLAGESVVESPTGTARQFLWDPSAVYRSGLLEDYDRAVGALQSTVGVCVASWTAIHRRILHNLSGGFDSAVVLANIPRGAGGPYVVCVNRYTEQAGEDERSYARAAAEHAGVPLIERAWSTGVRALDGNMYTLPLMPKPAVAALLEFLDLACVNDLASGLAVDAVWTGQGGDHLFFQYSTDLAAADFVHDHGLSSGLLRAVRDAARFSRQSYWHVIRRAVFDRTPRQWAPDFFADRKAPFLTTDALPREERLAYILHPWHETSAGLPTGKRLQILLYGELLNRHAPIPGAEYADQHHPLLSQPLLELCLRIPTYLLLKGGRHRALARIAFKDQIPRQIVERESKGATTSYFTRVFRESVPFIRELLLDGVLVQERILNREALQPYLTASRPARVGDFFPMLACITAELWVRQWTRRVQSAAA